jgi:hypothetical protein
MTINHGVIRNILKSIGILLFLASVGIKLRQIILYGGTSSIKDPNGDESDPGTTDAPEHIAHKEEQADDYPY